MTMLSRSAPPASRVSRVLFDRFAFAGRGYIVLHPLLLLARVRLRTLAVALVLDWSSAPFVLRIVCSTFSFGR